MYLLCRSTGKCLGPQKESLGGGAPQDGAGDNPPERRVHGGTCGWQKKNKTRDLRGTKVEEYEGGKDQKSDKKISWSCVREAEAMQLRGNGSGKI